MPRGFGNQRWRRGRAIYRPPAEPIRTANYEVIELPDDRLAKAFVVEHHYSGSYPAARWRFGLFYRGLLQGVAVFSHLQRPRADIPLSRPGHRRRGVGSLRAAR